MRCDGNLASTPPPVALPAKDFHGNIPGPRGKGTSGDTQPYAVERGIGDSGILINAAGVGHTYIDPSSGCGTGQQAAAKPGSRINKLALCEAPYDGDPVCLEGSFG